MSSFVQGTKKRHMPSSLCELFLPSLVAYLKGRAGGLETRPESTPFCQTHLSIESLS